jgi:hypothetical protein
MDGKTSRSWKAALWLGHIQGKNKNKQTMKKEKLNFVIDSVAFVAFVLLISTGVLMRYILPAGSGHFIMLWGMDRHEWGQLHFWLAVVFMVSRGLHRLFHWRWIVHVIKGGQHRGSVIRVALSVFGLIILIGIAAIPLFGTVEQKGEPPHKLQSIEPVGNHNYNIDGSMTLKDVERLTGVSGAVIIGELGLPGNMPIDENLGSLRKEYGFELNDLREVMRKRVEKKGRLDE